MKKIDGSAGIVEMTFILPITVSICLTLIYFVFSVFSYAYTYCVADEILNCFEENAKGNGLYWYLCASPYSDEQMEISVQTAEKLLKNTKILPGADYSFNVKLKKHILGIKIQIHIDYVYFNKRAFSIDLERPINRPAEFIVLTEFFLENEELSGDIEKVKEALGGVF